MSALIDKLTEIKNQKDAIKGVLSAYIATVPAFSGYATAFDGVISAQISAKISAEAERDQAVSEKEAAESQLAQADALADSIIA